MGDLAPKIDVPAVLTKATGFAAIAAAFAGHPAIGAGVASALTCLIPERRTQRLERLAERLNDRVSRITPELAPETFDDEYNLSLLEDSMIAASRATSTDRIDYIASILANGLTSKDAKRLDRKYLLSSLNEMNDIEVLLLCSKAYNTYGSGEEFWEKHKDALAYEHATLGSPPSVHNLQAIREAYLDHLVRLGVLEEEFHTPSKHNPVEFDRHGKMKGGWRQLSHLGRLLLREIGQPTDLDPK